MASMVCGAFHDPLNGPLRAGDVEPSHWRLKDVDDSKTENAAVKARRVAELYAEVLNLRPPIILSRISDGSTLAKCSMVNRSWRKEAEKEAYWERLSVLRWCLSGHRRACLDTAGSSFWKHVYVQGHQNDRQPASDFSGERFPAFACSRLPPTESEELKLKVWVNCCHSSDCKLLTVKNDGIRYLSLYVVIQNFDQRPVSIATSTLRLTLRDGAIVSPLPGVSPAVPKIKVLCMSQKDGKMRSCRRDGLTGVTLKHLESAVLGDCLFAMPDDSTYEPDGLECCDELLLTAVRAGRDDGGEAMVRARFDEGRVWRHYAKLNGSFWVFSERGDHSGY